VAPKSTQYTYDDWKPGRGQGKNPYYVRQMQDWEIIQNTRLSTTPEEFPARLSKIASQYPTMSLGSMVGMAQVGANSEVLEAVARLDALKNNQTPALTNLTGASMVGAGESGYKYLEALGKTEETATEQDKQDAWYYAGLKGGVRYLTTGWSTAWQLIGNTARQLDAAYNVAIDRNAENKGRTRAGENALDFSQIYKDTYLYQNLVEGRSLGEGFFPGGDAYEETERLAASIATVNGKAYTPGRGLEGMLGIDPGDRGYGIISGILDGFMSLKLDPGLRYSKWKDAKNVAKLKEEQISGIALGSAISAQAGEITAAAIDQARLLSSTRVKDAAAKARQTQEELDAEYAKVIEEIRFNDELIAKGKLAPNTQSVDALRKSSGIDNLYNQRDRLLAQIDEFKTTKEIVVRDAQTSKTLTGAAGAKFLRDQIKMVDNQINSALDKIYLQRDPVAMQLINRLRGDALAAVDELAAARKAAKDPKAKQELIERVRAGIIEGADGYRVNLEKAREWFAKGNADEVFQKIADETSPTAIQKLGNGRWGSELSADLARAKTIDEVEEIMLPQIGIKILPGVERSIPGRYIVDPVKTFALRSGVVRTVTEKISKKTDRLFDYMPTGRPVHLQQTEELVEESRRWMVSAGLDAETIAKTLDELILSDKHNYPVRQQIIIKMLESVAKKFKEDNNLSNAVNNKIDRAVVAYSSELSGLREYGSETAGDVFRKVLIANGEEFDLSGKPTSIAQLAHEIVLPNVNELRMLVGRLGKLQTWLDNRPKNKVDALAAAKFARWLNDGFLRQILLVGRGAYILRNILEMQSRLFLAGGQNMFTNPVAFISVAMSNTKTGGKLAAVAQKYDPYKVDVTGRRFVDQDAADMISQEIYNSHVQVMASRGFSQDARSFGSALRTGEFGLMQFTGRNATEYAEALTYRLLSHYADPLKRAIISNTLPKKYQKLVDNGDMPFEDAFMQAVRDGAFKQQIDVLGKAVPEIRRLLSTNEGMRLFFFDDADSYRNEVLRESLGNVEWRNFVGTGKITEPIKSTVKDPNTGELVDIIDNRVIFEIGPDHIKNVKEIKRIITKNLQDKNSVEYARALELSLPAMKKVDYKTKYGQFVDNFFRFAANVESRAVYGPEYRIAYWDAVADLAPLMSKDAARALLDDAFDIKNTDVVIENADGTKTIQKWIKNNPAFESIKEAARSGKGYLTSKDIDAYARDKAAKNLANLFYDASQKKNIAYAWQLVLPFANAWANTLYKWGELASSPSRLGARAIPASNLFQTLQSQESTVIYDVLNTPHDPTQGFIYENAYGEKVFTIPLSGYLLTAFGTLGDPQGANITVPVTSLNLVAAGASLPGTDLGIIPGVGTLWNALYSTMPSSMKESIPPLIGNIIAPYGDQSGNLLGGMPSWAQKIVNGARGTDQARLKFTKPIMAWEVTSNPKYKVLFDGTPLTIEERAALQEELTTFATNKSQWIYFIQGAIQNVLPGTPVYEYYAKNENNETFFQWQMANALNDLFEVYDGNFEMAVAEFGSVFGRQALLASMGGTEGSIFADDRAWQFATSNPNAFKSYSEVIPYFFVGSDFSTEYKRAMQRRGYGEPLSTKELIAEADSLTLAAVKGQLAIESARNGYGTQWIDDQMAKYKMTVLQGYEPEVTISTNKLAQKIIKIESALKRPEFQQIPAGQAAIKYTQARQAALQIAASRYPDRKAPSLSGEENADLRYQLETLGQQLSQGNPDWANMYQRVYLKELRKD
jgi:hypothetical protein